jgi:hypothetical protein
MTKTPSDDALLFALQEWKKTGKEITLDVQGNSMLPLIKPGARVVIKLIDPHGLRSGDLFAFVTGDHVTVHRFVKKRKDGDGWWFCEVGDNAAEWGWVPEGKVWGVVQEVHSAGVTLEMHARPWVWVNGIFGLTISFSVTLCEDLERVNFRGFWRQGAWNVHRAIKKLLRKTIHEVTRRKTKTHERSI